MTLQRKGRLVARAALVVALLVSAGCGDDADDTASTTTTAAATDATTGAPGGPATTGPGGPGGGAPSGGPASTAPSQAERLITVVVRGGTVEGGGRHKVNLDEEVRLRVTSDVADEVHIHGYEQRFDVRPGEAAEFGFVAILPGVFEVELERAGKRLLDLEVQP